MPGNLKKVVVVGDVGLDIIVHFPKYLDNERKRVAFEVPSMEGGGTGANTAAALTKMGISPYILGTVGDDAYGKFVLKDLIDEHIHIDYLKVDQTVNTVGVFAFVDEYGERYLWGWPRTDRCFEKLELTDRDFALLETADWIHSTGMITVRDTSARKRVEEIFEFAHERGITTSYDLNLRVTNDVLDESFKRATCRILENCTYVLGSAEEEIFYLDDEKDWRKTAQKLVRSDRTIVARMGENGSIAFTDKGEIQMPAYCVKVKDTIGAGDVFNGAFIYGCLNGYDMNETLDLCNAVAGYSVEHEGARSAPTIAELETFVGQANKRR